MYFTAGSRAAVTAGAQCHRPGVSKLERSIRSRDDAFSPVSSEDHGLQAMVTSIKNDV